MKKRLIIQTVIYFLSLVVLVTGLVFNLVRDTKFINLVKYFQLLFTQVGILVLILAIVTNIISLAKNKEDDFQWFFILKLVTGVALLTSFLSMICYFQWNIPEAKDNILEVIFLNYCGPLLYLVGFIGFDITFKRSFKLSLFGPILVLIYSVYTIMLATFGSWGNLYNIFNFKENETLINVLVPIVIIIGSFCLSFLLWLINRFFYNIFEGEEIDTSEALSNEEQIVDDTVVVTKEDEEVLTSEIKKAKDEGTTLVRTYHISKRRSDGLWQVRFANGKRAIKLFKTQAEAIVFAKKLALSQDGSIRVHSVKGRIRKA